MKQSARSTVLIALTVALSGNSLPVLAATGIVVASHVGPRIQTAASGRVSDRLIVKFKPSSLLQGMSANTQLMQPLSAGIIVQLQAVANTSLSESHAISNGAHVITLGGQPDRQAMDSAIAAISSLSNVEYVEEDRILTAQAVPNDGMYLTVTSGSTTCNFTLCPTRNPASRSACSISTCSRAKANTTTSLSSTSSTASSCPTAITSAQPSRSSAISRRRPGTDLHCSRTTTSKRFFMSSAMRCTPS